MTGNLTEKRYMPGLDGLRALAVFAVIAFHLNLPFAPGGFLGVTLFFVLSGYLITDILISEFQNLGTIRLKDFFIRRAKRLLPGTLFLLLFLTAFITVFRPDLLNSLKSDALPAVFFFSNWWYIFREVPYFATFSNPVILNHFWSLAIEAQFYLIWPVLLLFGQRLFRKKWPNLAGAAVLAAISAALMALLFRPGEDTGRIYYGTDTRVFSLLMGACMAFAVPAAKLAAPVRKKAARIALDAGGFIALFAVLFMTYYITQYDDFLYLGGMAVFSAASVLLIAAAANPSTVVGRLFSFKPLRFIGKISYGVYLWQYPIIIITNAMFPSNRLNAVLCISQVAATFLMAVISYYLIEKPIRQKKFRTSLRKSTFRGFCGNFLKLRWQAKTAALLVIALALVSGAGLLGARAVPGVPEEDMRAEASPAAPETPEYDVTESPAPSPNPPPEHDDPSQAFHQQSGDSPSVSADPSGSPAPSGSPGTSASETPPPSGEPSGAPDPSDPADPSGSPEPSGAEASAEPPGDPEDEITPSDLRVTVVGDSVALDYEPYLRKYYPNMNIDAKEGRQFYQAKTIVKKMIQNKTLGTTVVIGLGSNGSFSETAMRSLIDLIGSDRKIVFVNAQVPRPWCATVNDTLAKVCAEYENTIVADWYTASLDKSEYFYKDGFHPNKTGSPILAKLVAEAIESIQDAP